MPSDIPSSMTAYMRCWTDNLYHYYLVVVSAYTDDKDMKSFLKDWTAVKKVDPNILDYTVIDGDINDPNYIHGKAKD
jgi:hypothetical protein